jgi:hypothetical protein
MLQRLEKVADQRAFDRVKAREAELSSIFAKLSELRAAVERFEAWAERFEASATEAGAAVDRFLKIAA